MKSDIYIHFSPLDSILKHHTGICSNSENAPSIPGSLPWLKWQIAAKRSYQTWSPFLTKASIFPLNASWQKTFNKLHGFASIRHFTADSCDRFSIISWMLLPMTSTDNKSPIYKLQNIAFSLPAGRPSQRISG